ncbi:glycoside hydrolase superfamily [Aspergillus spinulosporus]
MWLLWPAATALFALPGARSAASICPAPCTTDPSKWTPYSSLGNLTDCHHPVLLDFSSHRYSNASEVPFKLLACTIEEDRYPSFVSRFATRELEDIGPSDSVDDVVSPSQELDSFLDRLQTVVNQTSSRDTFSVLGSLNTTWVGIYRGATVDDATAASAVKRLRNEWDTQPPRRAAIQLCGGDRDANHTFGIALATTGSIEFVQEAISAWTVGRCFLSQNAFNLEYFPVVEQPTRELRLSNETIADNATLTRLSLEYACKKETVEEGDTCATLAKRCGVSEPELMKYNPKQQLCRWLQPGEEVCCSSKKWRKGKPVINKDGSCAAYLTEDNDTCASIAQAHNMEVGRIRYYNDGRTWGWSGCDQIYGGLRICLSDGYPPIPAPKSGAICGPTVPGTEQPLDGTPLAALNPCPLNACCNTLGECGATPDYCTYEEGPTGNPGTAPPGKNGCISNCGMEIVNNSPPPTEFMRIGYYESFNLDRPCLNLQAAHIKVNDYSHIHWAFVSINNDFQISVNDTYNQWEDFIALKGVKRIASFGGWGYSVNSASYDVLREAMLPENVDTFIVSIMEFVADNNLDGVDFDWEYPGTADVLNISPGLESDGPNYVAFIKKLRKIFPSDKTISVAAPATYWHLKSFPIEEMWQHVDYLIYMTYDFHGQWEYENSFIQDWCDGGNCLRSHVNLTETEWALSMITKAGVPRNAITIGVASYGRTFKMADADCIRPECKFTGPQTAAIPGMCTKTPGIIAIAEIEALMIEGDINESFYDPASDSNILVYNDTQWVGFMSKSTMRRRVERYREMNFAGFANWAVDLTHWSGDDIEVEEANMWGLPKEDPST